MAVSPIASAAPTGMNCARAAPSGLRHQPPSRRGDQGHLTLRECIASQPEAIMAVVLGDSPYS